MKQNFFPKKINKKLEECKGVCSKDWRTYFTCKKTTFNTQNHMIPCRPLGLTPANCQNAPPSRSGTMGDNPSGLKSDGSVAPETICFSWCHETINLLLWQIPHYRIQERRKRERLILRKQARAEKQLADLSLLILESDSAGTLVQWGGVWDLAFVTGTS